MENIFFLAGIAGSVGGVCLMFYQGIMYLMHNDRTQYTILTLVDKGPDAVRDQIYASPQIIHAFESCPLFLAFIVLGLILLFIGSALKNRYA